MLGVTALEKFVRESNLIEGIDRVPTDYELGAHRRLLACDYLTLKSVEDFVFDICGKQLRREVGMDVRVGPHVPPRGGPSIPPELAAILDQANGREATAFMVHVAYEKLHPFMDGNGRSGRAVWVWMMRREGRDPFSLPFLHRWYYQSLDASRVPVGAQSC
jgi:Fic/DOC family